MTHILRPPQTPGDLKGAAAPWPMGKDSASLFAGIRRSSRWSLLENSGETSFSNRNDMFRFEEEEPPSDTKFSQYYGPAETERATCAPTRFPLACLCLLSPRADCQVKCNTQSKKTSYGVFQPRHLRGRVLSFSTASKTAISETGAIS